MDLIPLSKLDQSDDNVCKTPNPEFEERLSHDIEARGVLQNLIVTKSSKRGRYEVIAGGKRMRAMHMIVERGAMQPDFEVQCLVIDKKVHNASEISLAENFQRLAMTPAEECRAFQHFIKEDGDTAAVAKRFGLTRRFVEGRLRLANLAEPIFEKLAAGELTLEIAKAYAATDQHEVQLRVFEQFRHSYYANADAIRRAIADGSMRGNDPIALLVGEEAYIAAGGKIERDLFSDSADDRWIDIPIAHELASAKMEAEAERLASETGLAWINPVASTSSWHARNEMNLNVVRLPAAPITEKARKRIDEIDARTDEINEIFDKQEHEPDDDFDEDALETEFSKLEDERDELSNPTRELPEEWKPEVGRFLILTNTGAMILDNDYFSEKYLSFEQDEDGNLTGGFTENKPSSPSRPATPSSTEAEAPGGAKPISAKLFDELSVQRRNILSASLLGNPGLALDYAIFALADTKSYESKGTTIKGGKPHDPVNGDIPTSSAEAIIAQAYDDLDKGWTEHRDLVERFNAFRALGDDAKATWLAYVVAISLEAKKGYQSEYQPIHAVLGNLLDIDVASMWRPTSENFFDRIPKGACLAALTEVGGSELAARYSASKKADLSTTCEKLFSGDAIVEEEVKERAVTWLPKAMTFDLPVVADDDTADNEFDDDEFDGEAADGEIEGENASDVDEPTEDATDEPETAEEEAEVDA